MPKSPLVLFLFASTVLAQGPKLTPARAIALPGVIGRIDHLAYDAGSNRLFVAALGNNSLEAIDLGKGEVAGRVRDLDEPQGVVVAAARKLVLVACGGDGMLRAYDCATLEAKGTLFVGDDADNVRLSADGATLLVATGRGLALVDAAKLQLRATVRLPAHPESFQLGKGGTLAFVNVPGARPPAVLVVDVAERKVTATYPLTKARNNYPMAFDEGRQRLLVACRTPARLCELDSSNGELLAVLHCVEDADDVFLDSERALVLGGGGRVDLFARLEKGWALVAQADTAPGARTGLWVPELRTLFVAVPKLADEPASIRELQLAK